jgi:hypothetical protein
MLSVGLNPGDSVVIYTPDGKVTLSCKPPFEGTPNLARMVIDAPEIIRIEHKKASRKYTRKSH